MTPREFILHWHKAARIAQPRFLPPMWERHADELMGKGITAEDLTLVAKWMLTQLARSQQGERNSVAFNAASFGWVKMFGEWGASNQDANFLGKLTLAEAARKPSAPVIQKPCAVPTPPVDAAKSREEAAKVYREFQEKMRGGSQP